MKKQTKLVATLSTAALLALGFSAVSMAAGWDNSTGAWRYLNNDGTEVVDEWKSANGNWFYLDSDGVMATDKLIEDESSTKGTKYYYVDQYGAMVKNTWKAVAMDDDDDSNLDAEYWWLLLLSPITRSQRISLRLSLVSSMHSMRKVICCTDGLLQQMVIILSRMMMIRLGRLQPTISMVGMTVTLRLVGLRSL